MFLKELYTNSSLHENKAVKKAMMRMPDEKEYEEILMVKDGILKLSPSLEPYKYKFYIGDSNGRLLYKIKQVFGSIPDTFIIYDPFNKELGKIISKVERLSPSYEVEIYGKSNFSIEKLSDQTDQNYGALGLHLIFQGDYVNLDYSVYTFEGKELATISSNPNYGPFFADIKLFDNENKLEIASSVVCSILGKNMLR